jgi:hypothetical protein
MLEVRKVAGVEHAADKLFDHWISLHVHAGCAVGCGGAFL